MIRFDIVDYCRVSFNNCVEIPDDVVKEFLKDCRSRELSEEDASDELKDYIDEIKWDYVTDRETIDEDCDDSEVDYEAFDAAIDEAMSWYEEPSKKFIGDFGND